MADLFKNVAPKINSNYTAEDIEVLEGLEPVRRRPGMYIGGTDQKALHHLVAEILDNAMDEVVAKFATEVHVIFHADNRITVKDNGRGIPVDPHPKFPSQSALEVILTTLHSGGKFSSKSYETSGGLHGVGLSVVNALSDKLDVTIWRDGHCYTQAYSRGHAIDSIQSAPASNARLKGTQISFHPDAEIFGDLTFKAFDLFNLVKSKAYLQKGVKVHWICEDKTIENVPSKQTFFFPNGLQDFLLQGQEGLSLDSIFSGDGAFPDGQGRVEWSLQWLDIPKDSEEPSVLTFCNTIPTPLGGTHEVGFRSALLKAIKEMGERVNKKSAQITQDDIDISIRSVVSCFIKQPQFQGQTKEKLVSQQATRLLDTVVKNSLDHWFLDHPSNAERIINTLVERSEERLRRRQEKDVSRASATKRLKLPGKLADCTKTNPADCEVFIVEGDSAGGTAKQARSRQTQAVLPLRGKILNVATASLDKLKANQQIADLILALGCGVGKSCNPDKLRYHKVIIMTDADVDGAHIASLLLTFFYQELRPVLEQGHIYLAMPPLYRLSGSGKIIYAQDDAEKDRIIKTEFKKNAKVEISRFKGLGEMPMEQLRSTTMDPTKRRLQQVYIKDDASLKDFVDRLMGKNAETRYQFIVDNAQFAKDLDV